ncbi:hypothetical protein C7271_16750, partial [filamentous cyanobacterium CCP5]
MAPFWLLVGLPGSGKSAWATQHVAEYPDCCLVSTDAIRAELFGDEATQGEWQVVWAEVQRRWQQAIAHPLTKGLIYDATNTRRRQRRTVVAVARSLGFKPIIICWFDVPLELCLRRNRERSRQVPEAVIIRMARQLQGATPDLDEGVDQVRRLGIGGEGVMMETSQAADGIQSEFESVALISPPLAQQLRLGRSSRLGVMASGNGSNLAAIAGAIARGDLVASIEVLIYNQPDAYAAHRAEQLGIPAVLLDHRRFPNPEDLDQTIITLFPHYQGDWGIMAGWMRRG